MYRILISIIILAAFATPAASPVATPTTSGAPVTSRWTASFGELPGSPALVQDGLVVITAGTSLQALQAETGELVWAVVLPSPVSAYVTIIDGAVFAPGEGGMLTVLELESGEQLHQSVLSFEGLSSLVELNNLIYTVDFQGSLIEIDPSSWTSRMVMALPDTVDAPIVAVGSTLVLAVKDGSVLGIDPVEDSILWNNAFPGSAGEMLPIGDTTIAIGTHDGRISLLDTTDGAITWETIVSSESVIDLVTGADDSVLATDSTGALFALDAATGAIETTEALMDKAWFGSDTCDPECHVLGKDGTLYRFDSQTQDLQIQASVPVPALRGTEYEGTFYVLTPEGDCYAIAIGD